MSAPTLAQIQNSPWLYHAALTKTSQPPLPPGGRVPHANMDWRKTSDHLRSVMDPVMLTKCVDQAAIYLGTDTYDAIAVSGVSGAVFGTMLAHQLKVPLCLVRKGESTHSYQKSVEGPDEVLSYVFVDDLICSGNTFDRVLKKMSDRYPQARCVGFYTYHDNLSQESKYWPATCRDERAGKYLNR